MQGLCITHILLEKNMKETKHGLKYENTKS